MMTKMGFNLGKHEFSTMCAVLLITSQLFSSVTCASVPRIVHRTIADNLMSAAMISSAAALGPRPKPAIAFDLALAAPGQLASAAIAPVAAAVASQAISNAISSSGSSNLQQGLFGAMPTMSAAVAAAAAHAPSVFNSDAPGISLQRRLMRAIAKEAFAYLAAPLFMPMAISRALFQPQGLPQEQAVLRRFGRFLAARLRQPDRKTQQVKPLNKAQIKLLINAVKYRNAYKKQVH